MKLANPFPNEVRELFRDCWECWICHENGQRTGGLELNHITGRDSLAAFNASVLCKGCHTHIGHNNEEEAMLTLITIKYLHSIGYAVQDQDLQHLTDHPYLDTIDLQNWLHEKQKTGN